MVYHKFKACKQDGRPHMDMWGISYKSVQSFGDPSGAGSKKAQEAAVQSKKNSLICGTLDGLGRDQVPIWL